MGNMTKQQILDRYAVDNIGRICIFGAGDYGKKLYRMLKISNISVDMFADNDSMKWNGFIIDEVVCQSTDTLLPDNGSLLIIVAVKNNPEFIAKELTNKGFKKIALMRDVEGELVNNIRDLINDIGIDLIYYMAYTGEGTDKCLEHSCFPMQVHFYQPIPNIKDLERRNVWARKSKLSGIGWEPEKYVENLKDIAIYKPVSEWTLKSGSDPLEFSLDNNSFSYICASFLYGMIRKNHPKRIVEIGSGNSSKVIRKAINDNLNDTAPSCNHTISYTIIDPYCSFDQPSFMPEGGEILKIPVEEVELSLFEELEENDILFIDSSHTVRIGGDVNYEILDILPVLARGVLIHFHDIPMPYEYHKVYSTNPEFRVFWTESYMLQAFLAFNDSFEVLLPAAYLLKEYFEVCKSYYPDMLDSSNWYSDGLWVRRKR